MNALFNAIYSKRIVIAIRRAFLVTGQTNCE